MLLFVSIERSYTLSDTLTIANSVLSSPYSLPMKGMGYTACLGWSDL